jgi:phage gpG-like protein
MIEIDLGGDRAVVARLDALPAKAHQGLARAIAQLGFVLQRKVRQEKLSGQALQVRPGRLRSSVDTLIEEKGNKVSAAIGTAVKYGRFHAYGVPHSWLAQARRAKALPFDPSTSSGGGRALFRQNLAHLGLSERSFLHSAFAEMAQEIAPRLAAALREALEA